MRQSKDYDEPLKSFASFVNQVKFSLVEVRN